MTDVNTPYVSVIMTSFNRGHYIGQALDAVLAQDCTFPFEVIIGDNGSTDASRDLLRDYQARYPDTIVLNYQTENIGFGANWASTCLLARGRYLAFCDDDDYWCDTRHLQLLADYLNTHDACGLVHADRWILDVATGTQHRSHAHIPPDADQLDYLLHRSYPILFSATMIRRSMLDHYVDLNAYVRLRFPIQDFPTAVLLARHCDFHFIDTPTVVYRSYAGSMSKPLEYQTVVHKYLQEKVMNRYLYNQLGLPYDERRDDRHRHDILLAMAYQRGDYVNARRFARHADPRNKKRWFALTRLTFHAFRWTKRLIRGPYTVR